jgi:Tol biopolymer transport system component
MELSPDGKWVLTSMPPVPDKPPRLVLVPTGVGEPRTLEYKGFEQVAAANWLPGGERILFAGVQPGRRIRLYVQEIAAGNPRPITSEGVGLRGNSHAISPDGKFVIGGPPQERECFLYPIEGGSPRPVRGLELKEGPIQWSADGREIYVVREGIPFTVWLLDPETGKRRLWKEIHESNPGFDTAFKIRVSPDGRSYAYSWNRNLSELYVVDGLK